MMVRTCILSLCMVVVPALAMFSHHVPADLRAAATCDIWQPLVERMQGWLDPAEPITADGSPVAPAGQPAVVGTTAAVASAAPTVGEAGAAFADAALESELPPEQEDGARRLAALGGLAIDCRPLEGVAGMHVASCRVAMDAAGQLHRVFQAAGPDPAAATEALAAQVAAWRERLAFRDGGSAQPPRLQ
jgi:hypothetical protein